jgi:NifB/MoaA-like Fe-S oxidoreductase
MADENEPRSEMKSAYELALERLEEQGIERPREEGLDSETQEKIAEARRICKAKLAEIEILLKDHLNTSLELAERQEAEEKYLRERSRLEQKRDTEIEAIRAGS